MLELAPSVPVVPVRVPPVDTLAVWGDSRTLARRPPLRVERAGDAVTLAHYAAMRRRVFVEMQGLLGDRPGSTAPAERDAVDEDSRAIVLVARAIGGPRDGRVIGGVRLAPATADEDIGWWQGSRLVVDPDLGGAGLPGTGAALVRAACAYAEAAGALRFDATVQRDKEMFFARLGWTTIRPTMFAGRPHVLMRWPINRIAALAAATKAPLGGLLAGIRPGGDGFVGDDGAPVPGSDLVAACDAVLPSMVGRDPHWAGWCSVLVNVNDLGAMGAEPVGMLDAVAGPTTSAVRRTLRGIMEGSRAFDIPILGGHTQVGVPPGLSVTALGRTPAPVPAGGGRGGHTVTVTADLAGGWRFGYTGSQWDSTSARRTCELRAMLGVTGRARPAAAKDVSMAGIVGTLGMLAEASACRAVLDVARVPRPAGVTAGDWLTCFPGFGLVTTDYPERPLPPAGPAVSAACGELTAGSGTFLRWPDGEITPALAGRVSGLGRA
jgi:putative N-acetyltransferase (TIGR04045 family)